MKIPVKKTSAICACAALSFTVLRFLQIFFCTDAVSGFFKSGYEDLGSELSIIIFVFIFLSFVFSFFEKKVPKAFPKNSFSLSIGSAILSGFLIADLILLPKTFSPPSWQTLIFLITGAITVFLLIFSAISYFLNFPIFKVIHLSPMFSVVPLVFFIIRSIICFAFYTELAVVSETLFNICAILCILFLLLYIAFLNNGIEPVKTSKRLLPLFVLAILSCVNISVPQFFLFVFGFENTVHDFSVNNFTFLGILIYLVVLYFNLFDEKNMKKRTKKHAKENQIFKH